jgi:hypothetical protein
VIFAFDKTASIPFNDGSAGHSAHFDVKTNVDTRESDEIRAAGTTPHEREGSP